MEPDYKKMYYKMMNAAEAAMNLIIEAQQECEEIYLEAEETPVMKNQSVEPSP